MNWDNQNLWESFVTPYVWEVTRVTPADIQRTQSAQEAMDVIKQKIFASNMSRQDIRVVMWAIAYREKLLNIVR